MAKVRDAEPEQTPSIPSEEGLLGPEVSVKRIQVLNLVLIALAAVIGLGVSFNFFWGVVAGGATMAASFGVIAAVIKSVFTKSGASPFNIGIYWLKFVGILAMVGAFVLVFRLDPLGLLVGLSTILLAITLEAVLRLAGK